MAVSSRWVASALSLAFSAKRSTAMVISMSGLVASPPGEGASVRTNSFQLASLCAGESGCRGKTRGDGPLMFIIPTQYWAWCWSADCN